MRYSSRKGNIVSQGKRVSWRKFLKRWTPRRTWQPEKNRYLLTVIKKRTKFWRKLFKSIRALKRTVERTQLKKVLSLCFSPSRPKKIGDSTLQRSNTILCIASSMSMMQVTIKSSKSYCQESVLILKIPRSICLIKSQQRTALTWASPKMILTVLCQKPPLKLDLKMILNWEVESTEACLTETFQNTKAEKIPTNSSTSLLLIQRFRQYLPQSKAAIKLIHTIE